MRDLKLQFDTLQVTIRSSVITKLINFRQSDPFTPESCGILLGFEWENAVEIIEATSPQPSDYRSRNGYIRDVKGHLNIAMALWRESDRLIGYLGEWHSHPERIPSPSPKDIREGKLIAKANKSRVVSTIIGTKIGCCYVVSSKSVSPIQTFDLTVGDLQERSEC